MIESNVIEWLDFGDSAQKLDLFTKPQLLQIFYFFQNLINYNSFPYLFQIALRIISFIQLYSVTSYFTDEKNDVIIEILFYLKSVILFYDLLETSYIYKIAYIIIIILIIVQIAFILILLFTVRKINLKIFAYLTNFINLIICHYAIGPIIEICFIVFYCHNGHHNFLEVSCYNNSEHILNVLFSCIIVLLYIFVASMHAIYVNEVGTITTNMSRKITRVHCYYEFISLINKIIIFVFSFIVKLRDKNVKIIYLYLIWIFFVSLFMSVYIHKKVYYYNNDLINYITTCGWFFSTWLTLCLLLKQIFDIKITSTVIIGWLIILFLYYRVNTMNDLVIITEYNPFELQDMKTIERHNSILLDKLIDKKSSSSNIFIQGIIKNFDEYISNNPELNYHFNKLLRNEYLYSKYNKENDIPILYIIYTIYHIQLEKLKNKEEIAIYFSYFLVNKLNNPTYALYLCSKIKSSTHLGLFHKFLLSENIKKFLTYKLKNLYKQSIKHVQIGSIILYDLYNNLFRIKIYDGTCSQIDYFDLLRNNITQNKMTENFLKTGNNILKIRSDILKIWEKIVQLNPFSDETFKDYMLYLDTILQDEILSKEESKKYMLLKNSKSEERNNTYHTMFMYEKSAILLVDYFISSGKILYASPNFFDIFSYNGKEILNLTIDDLLPNVIQTFHKELIEDAIKYSNMNYKFRKPINSLLKSKNGGLFNVTLFVKPVPNISYGLTFFSYLEKNFQTNFIVILDKDLKINAFSEVDAPFTMEKGYNLKHGLYGYHIGVIIPDILPMIEYKNDEFNIIKTNMELKGYLYQTSDLMNVKPKVDVVLEKIKNGKNIGNGEKEMQYEDNLQNISEEFNELINQLTKEQEKPISIFYNVQKQTFIDGKHKYYRIYINDDIIPGEKALSQVKQDLEKSNFYEQGSKKKIKKNVNGVNNFDRYIHNKSKDDQNLEEINEIEEQIYEGSNKKSNKEEKSSEPSNVEQNKEKENPNKDINSKNKEINQNQEDKGKNNQNDKIIQKSSNLNINKSPFEYQARSGDSRFNKLKLEIIHKKQILPIKIMHYLCLIFACVTIILIIYNQSLIKGYFENIALFSKQNLLFNITKITIGVLYIQVSDVKLQLHKCFYDDEKYNYTSLYYKLISENIDLLIRIKDIFADINPEFKDLVDKKYNFELSIYGENNTEIYYFDLNNILTFFINGGINLLKSYNFLLNSTNLDSLTYGYIEFLDLENQTYNFYQNPSIVGFSNELKQSKIKNSANNFPFIINAIIYIALFLVYSFFLIRIHRIILIFINRLINFNKPNFDLYIKNLDDIKKKLQNEKEEEEKDDMDLNNSGTGDSSKKEEEEKSFRENKIRDDKKLRKNVKKNVSKIQKQKKNKIKVMTHYFVKNNLFFGIKVLLMLIISLFYYIISILIEFAQKEELLSFDKINDRMIGILKSVYDEFILIKKEIQIFEEKMVNCEILYNSQNNTMHIKTISNIKIPSFGNDIMRITTDFGFSGQALNNFSTLFVENITKSLEEVYPYELWRYKDLLINGMEQTLINMGSLFGVVVDELNHINVHQKEFKKLIQDSRYRNFELFLCVYYQKAILIAVELLNALRSQKLNSIVKTIKIVSISYIFITIIIFFLLVFIIFSLKDAFYSFIYFICILPFKYLSEDKDIYDEIIKLGDDYF